MSDYIVGSAAVLVKPIFTGFQQLIQKEFSSVLSTEATKAGRNAGKDMADAVGKEGGEAGEQFTDKLGKEVKGSKSKIDKSTKHLTNGMDKSFSKAGKESGKSFGSSLKSAMMPIAGIIAGIGIGAQIGDTITKASNSEQSLGATEAIFKNHASKVIGYSEEAAQKYGMSANTYREGSNLMGALFKNQGVEMDKLAGKTDQMVGIGADLAAQFGGTSVEAMEALSAAFKGEYDSLDKYGITMNETIVTDELKRLGQDKLTGSALALAKQEAKTNLIMKSSVDATGAAAREADTFAGSQARLIAKVDNLKESVGKPLIDALAKTFGFIETTVLPAVTKFGDYFQTTILPVLKDFRDYIVNTVFPAIQGLGTWLKDNADTIAIVAGVITLIMLPALVRWGTRSTIAGAQSVAAFVATKLEAIKSAAVFLLQSYRIIGGWIAMGLAAIKSAAQTVYVWALYKIEAVKAAIAMGVNAAKIVASWVLMQVKAGINAVKMAASWAVGVLVPAAKSAIAMGINAARVVGGWILMSVQSMVHATRMAAAWFIAMGPVGWVIAGIIGLAAIIILNWAKIKKFTIEAFTNVSNFLKTVWTNIKNWVVTKITELVIGAVTKFNELKTKATNIFNSVKAFFVTTFTAIRDRVTGFISGMITGAVNKFNGFKTSVRNIFTAVKNTISDIWNNKIKPIFSALGNFIKDTVVPGFQKGVDRIKSVWEKVANIARKPINFIVKSVYTDGLQKTFNGIAGNLGLPDKWRLPNAPTIPEFARGGWTGPGSKYQEAGVVHADEFVVQKSSQRSISRVAPGFLDSLNRLGAKALGYANGGLVKPLAGGSVTSRFGPRWGGLHAGIDFATPTGTPIFAAMDGTVQRAGNKAVSGRTGIGAFLGHEGNRNTYYGHLSRLLVGIGDQVKKGQQIALSGNTGNSSGPHLHFETWTGGKPVNPEAYLNGAALPSGGVGGGFNPLQGLFDLKDKMVGKFKGMFGEDNFLNKIASGSLNKIISGPIDWIKERAAAIGDVGQDIGGNIKDFFNGKDSGVQAAVRGVANQYGWGSGRNWNALSSLINKESSWDPHAANPQSSARGLFQKMTSLHGAVEGTPEGQAGWGLKYIKDRYGDPEKAWAFHKRNNSYADGGHVKAGLYDDGGWLQPGLTAALNKSGKPEAILTAKEWSSVHSLIKSNESRGGDTYNVAVPEPKASAQQIVDTIYHQTRVARRGGK